MTVKEIIEVLGKCNPDACVYVRHYGGYDSYYDESYNSWSEITSFIDVTDNGTEVNFRTNSAIPGLD